MPYVRQTLHKIFLVEARSSASGNLGDGSLAILGEPRRRRQPSCPPLEGLLLLMLRRWRRSLFGTLHVARLLSKNLSSMIGSSKDAAAAASKMRYCSTSSLSSLSVAVSLSRTPSQSAASIALVDRQVRLSFSIDCGQ